MFSTSGPSSTLLQVKRLSRRPFRLKPGPYQNILSISHQNYSGGRTVSRLYFHSASFSRLPRTYHDFPGRGSSRAWKTWAMKTRILPALVNFQPRNDPWHRVSLERQIWQFPIFLRSGPDGPHASMDFSAAEKPDESNTKGYIGSSFSCFVPQFIRSYYPQPIFFSSFKVVAQSTGDYCLLK